MFQKNQSYSLRLKDMLFTYLIYSFGTYLMKVLVTLHIIGIVNTELDTCRKNWPWFNLRYYRRTHLDNLNKITKNH